MRPFGAVALLIASLGYLVAGQVRQGTPAADFIFDNGKIVTLDGQSRTAAALAVAGERIIAVGSNQEVLAHRSATTRVIDLGGKTVLPGLQDSHIHPLGLGRDLTQRADFTYARSAEEILKTVRLLKMRLNPKLGEWIVGSRWDQHKYASMPTRWDLDEIAPDNPVRLSRTYEGVLVNTAVFKLMGIDDSRSSTWPSWWLKDPDNFTFEDKIVRAKRVLTVDGQRKELEIPTGEFLGTKGPRLVTARPPASTFEDDVESVRAGVQEMLRMGMTAMVDADSPGDHDMKVYEEAQNRGFLQMRVAVYFGSFYQQKPEEIRHILQPIDMHQPNSDFLRWRGTKFYSDGGAGTRSSWVSASFVNWQRLEGKENHGNPTMPDYAFREQQYRAAMDLGWDLHTHATGDLAMQETVKLYMKLMDEIHQKRPAADLRWSVIHAYLPMEPGTSVLAEMAKYHIIAVPNPVFQWQQGKGFVDNLGLERMARTQPFRSYLKAGIRMPSGSDYPITTPDPWIGIYALVTRRDQATGRVFGPDETISLVEALRSFTIDGAYLTYDDKIRGTLEVGKLADLVEIDVNDLGQVERNPDLLLHMTDRVLLTMVDGKIRYQKGMSASTAHRN